MKLSPLARQGSTFLALMLICTPHQVSAEQKTEAGSPEYRAAAGLQRDGEYELAAAAWAEFLNKYKSHSYAPQASFHLGVCYLKTKKPQQAVTTFQAVLANYPKFEILDATYLYLGIAQYTIASSGKAEMYDQAAETLNTLITKYPKSKHVAQAAFYRGECFYARGKKKEAAEAYSQVLQKSPDDTLRAETLYALGVAYEELGQQQAAGKIYDEYLKKFPNQRLATEVGLRRGETLFAEKQYQAAAKWFAAAAAKKDFALADQATIRQAAALAELKQFARAAALYASVPTNFPKSKDVGLANLAGGKCYYLSGNFAEARKLLGKVLATGGPEAPEAAHWIARSLLKEKKPTEALAAVEKALPQVREGPQAVQLLLDQADAVYEIPNRRGESVALYAALASKYPQDAAAPQALYMAGFAALGQGDYGAALKYADQFLGKHAANNLAADVMYIAAESNLQLDKFPEAEKLYEQLLQKYPDHADAETWKVRRALSAHVQKKYPETIAVLQPLLAEIRTPAAVAEAHYLIGSSQAELKQLDAAVKSLEASLGASPKWRQADDALLLLGRSYRQLNNLDKAIASTRKLIAEFPQSRLLDQAHYQLGQHSFTKGDYKTAAAEYQEVVTKWPESPLGPHALYGLGWSKLNLKDYAAAETALDKLVEKHPQHKLTARARYARGMARQQLGKFAPAIEDLQALLSADPSPAEKSDARYVVGLCQVELKKYAEAVATFTSLLKENPQYREADKVYYELAWAQKSLGKEAEAAEEFARVGPKYPNSPEVTDQYPNTALVAESNFHVGQYAYNSGRLKTAAVAYYGAMKKAGRTPLGEKAAYRLGWAYYRQNDFENARRTFRYQRAAWPKGPLISDGVFMEAECLFKQDKFAEALVLYEQVKSPTGKDYGALALLHASEAAAQLKQWPKSLDLATRCATQFPDSPYLPAALYQQGWAQQNLDKPDEAVKLYEEVIAGSNQEVAARARFMIGEIQFQKKQYADAITTYYIVIDGYSYPKWQAEATFEAARCYEALDKRAQALKRYQELVEKYPKSERVPDAKRKIEELKG